MLDLIVMAILGLFPVFRLWWVYRIKAIAINIVSWHAKQDLANGRSYSERYEYLEKQDTSLFAMFFKLNLWTVNQFYSSKTLNY